MSDVDKRDLRLVIQDRPQVSVEITEFGDVRIATATISDGFDSVDHNDVIIPLGDLPEVIGTLQAIWKERGGN
ncbi:hypothetical protein ISN75_02540 [Dyella marensis]|uniref:hypothetical protein n=1 Tax=Dyella marensis TaxID=500610 RepID=UPI0031E424A6